MEMELSGLIERIKTEGVAEAEKKAQHIIQHAEKRSRDIIHHAEEQYKGIIAKADQEADKLKKQAEESVRQAVRDALLMLKQKVTGLFDALIKRQITEQLTPKIMQEIIVKLVASFKENKVLDIEILLNKEDKEKLEKAVLNSLAAEMRQGVSFKVSPAIEKGFRIGEKDKNYYYDFTDEALAEALRAYLNPKLIKILDTK